MKLSKLIDPQFQAALRKLAAQDIPLKTAFKLRGTIKRGNDELAKYDEVRADTLKRLGDRTEAGDLDVDANGTVKLSADSMKLFVDQMNDLLKMDVDLGSVSINELGDKLALTTSELITLDDLITD